MTDPRRELQKRTLAVDASAPDFDSVYSRAEAHLADSRRRRRMLAGIAAAAALIALLLPLTAPDSPGLIMEDELFGTTSWSPPSDVLLPVRETNIYYEMPELRKSTGPAGGALL